MRSLPAKPIFEIPHPATSVEAHRTTDGGNLISGSATCIGRGDDGARAHSGDAVERDVFALQHPKNTQVRDTVRKSATQSKADAWGHRC